jgi:hypothetical protein
MKVKRKMNSEIKIKIAMLVMGGMGVTIVAQANLPGPTPAPHYYRCQTECFAMGDDGSQLFYHGGNTAYGQNTDGRDRAFQELSDECPFPNLQVHRTLTGIKSTTVSTPVTDISYACAEGWGWDAGRRRVRTYTFTNVETNAQFTTEQATSANSCLEINEDEMPDDDGGGDTIFG